MNFKALVREVPNFPKPGIVFLDITPLLENAEAFRGIIKKMAAEWRGKVDAIAALESRGFIFGSALAYELGVPLVLIRKKGKLPRKTVSLTYLLEYGTDTIEVHKDSFKSGMRVLVVDDLLATGGTARAACDLVTVCEATVAGCAFVIELCSLDGREKLGEYPVCSLLAYE